MNVSADKKIKTVLYKSPCITNMPVFTDEKRLHHMDLCIGSRISVSGGGGAI